MQRDLLCYTDRVRRKTIRSDGYADAGGRAPGAIRPHNDGCKCLLGFVRKDGFRHGNEGADGRCRRLLILFGFLHFLVAALLTFGHGVSPCFVRLWQTCLVQWAGGDLRSVG